MLLTMLTIAQANRGGPTVRDLKILTLNQCTRSILFKNSRIILYKNSRLNVSLNRTVKCCSNPVNRSTKNVLEEVNLQL